MKEKIDETPEEIMWEQIFGIGITQERIDEIARDGQEKIDIMMALAKWPFMRDFLIKHFQKDAQKDKPENTAE